jgi:hypothetical protein
MIAVKTAMGFELKQDSSLWFETDIFRLSFLCLLSMSLKQFSCYLFPIGLLRRFHRVIAPSR